MKAIGIDFYNLNVTYGVAKTMTSGRNDKSNIPCVVVLEEDYEADEASMVHETANGIWNRQLQSMHHRGVAMTLQAARADDHHIPSVMIANSSGGGVAGTLDGSYYKGCGERQGIEREYIVIGSHGEKTDDVSESDREPDGELTSGELLRTGCLQRYVCDGEEIWE